ncbi:MAG TPA: hypothetical protein VGK00_04930 [Anaerolineales bacterium]|jgi:hypothetical protein
MTYHLGSTSVTTDSLGNAVAELRYKPWGETRLAGGTMLSKYQFAGQYSKAFELGGSAWGDNQQRAIEKITITPRHYSY